jgi:hypothetical protein
MTGTRGAHDLQFQRIIELDRPSIHVTDRLTLVGSRRVSRLWIGGSFISRMVPQSKYFESSDLANLPLPASERDCETLARSGTVEIQRTLS